MNSSSSGIVISISYYLLCISSLLRCHFIIIIISITTWRLGVWLAVLKRPAISGWVVSGYLRSPLRKHCGNADKQRCKHVFTCEGQNSDPN